MKSAEPRKPLKDMMADCTEATKKDFEFEYQLMRNIAGINIDLFVLIFDRAITNSLELAIAILSVKNFRLLQCIDDCIFNGYYEAGMTLMRILYENLLLMEYFSYNEKEAGKWLAGKKLKAGYIRSKVGKDSKIYSLLSDYYTHANVESLLPLTRLSDDPQKLNLYLYPEYNRENAKFGLYLSIAYGWLNNLHLQYTFRGYLWENEDWKQRFIEWNEIVIKYIEERLIEKSAIKFEFAEKLP